MGGQFSGTNPDISPPTGSQQLPLPPPPSVIITTFNIYIQSNRNNWSFERKLQSVSLGSSWRKGQGRSGKIMEGHGRSYPNTRCVSNVRKVMGGGWWEIVACRIIVLSPGPGLCYSHEILKDSLTDSDWTWTGHGPGPAIAIKKLSSPSTSPKAQFQSPMSRGKGLDWGWCFNPTGHHPTHNFSHLKCQSCDGKRPSMTILDLP